MFKNFFTSANIDLLPSKPRHFELSNDDQHTINQKLSLISKAVRSFAHEMPAPLNTAVLTTVLTQHLEQNPYERDPYNIQIKKKRTSKEIVFKHYSLNYRIKQNEQGKYLSTYGKPEKILHFGTRIVGNRTYTGRFNIKDVLAEGKVTHSDGYTEEGIFNYDVNRAIHYLRSGIKFIPNSSSQEGLFEIIPQLGQAQLVKGSKIFLDGTKAKGTFRYCEITHSMQLYSGKKDYIDGSWEDGKFHFNTQVNQNSLKKGFKFIPNLGIYEGTFDFVPELGIIELIKGRIEYLDGTRENGHFRYFPEGKRMGLCEGEKKYPNGTWEEGSFYFDPITKMFFLYAGTESDPTEQTRSRPVPRTEDPPGAKAQEPAEFFENVFEQAPNPEEKLRRQQEQAQLKLAKTASTFIQEQMQYSIQKIETIVSKVNQDKASTKFEEAKLNLTEIESANNLVTSQEKFMQFIDSFSACIRSLKLAVHPDKQGNHQLANAYLAAIQQVKSHFTKAKESSTQKLEELAGNNLF